MKETVYGEGGYSATAPDGNVVNEREVSEPAEYTNADTMRAAVRSHLQDLRTIRDSSGTLTGAQLSNAVRALAKGQVHVIRLVVGALDATD